MIKFVKQKHQQQQLISSHQEANSYSSSYKSAKNFFKKKVVTPPTNKRKSIKFYNPIIDQSKYVFLYLYKKKSTYSKRFLFTFFSRANQMTRVLNLMETS